MKISSLNKLAVMFLSVFFFAGAFAEGSWKNYYSETPCADECCPLNEIGCNDCSFDLCNNWSAEFRIAWFRPSDRKFRKIYSGSLVDYQLEVSKRFWNNWELWLDVDYMTKKGRSIGFKDPTRITIIPVGLGLNYSFCLLPCTNLYVGAGVDCTFLRIHDQSDYVHKHIYKQNVGGTFKLGLKRYFGEHLFAEIFADYFVQNFDFHNHHSGRSFGSSSYVKRNNTNLSGLKLGGGIGWTF